MNDSLVGLLLVLAGLMLFLWPRKRRMRRRKAPLDAELARWTPDDPFTVRDLLNGGVLVLGRAGSGKTSSSGRFLMRSIVANPLSAGLIVCAKPEDIDDIRRVFKEAGRIGDLIVFSALSPYRFNVLDYLKGEDTRSVVNCLLAVKETLYRSKRRSGGENSQFWAEFEERVLMAAVGMLQLAGEPLTASNLLRYISGAATSPNVIGTPEWVEGYHSKICERAHNARKDRIQQGDYELYEEFWLREYPREDPKTRSNVIAGVMGTLSVFASGLAQIIRTHARN